MPLRDPAALCHPTATSNTRHTTPDPPPLTHQRPADRPWPPTPPHTPPPSPAAASPRGIKTCLPEPSLSSRAPTFPLQAWRHPGAVRTRRCATATRSAVNHGDPFPSGGPLASHTGGSPPFFLQVGRHQINPSLSPNRIAPGTSPKLLRHSPQQPLVSDAHPGQPTNCTSFVVYFMEFGVLTHPIECISAPEGPARHAAV